jgi:hypothetical protein
MVSLLSSRRSRRDDYTRGPSALPWPPRKRGHGVFIRYEQKQTGRALYCVSVHIRSRPCYEAFLCSTPSLDWTTAPSKTNQQARIYMSNLAGLTQKRRCVECRTNRDVSYRQAPESVQVHPLAVRAWRGWVPKPHCKAPNEKRRVGRSTLEAAEAP